MNELQWVFIAASIILQVLLIDSLIRGPYRRYGFVFAYSIVAFLTTVVDVAVKADIGKIREFVAQDYYRRELLRQFLLFSVVLSFIDRAVERSSVRHNLRMLLVGGAAVVVAGSWLIHRNVEFYPLMMTKIGRDLSFSSVVLNLLLWTILISQRTKDRDLLMVTGGLGLQFTGEAIGQSLRQVSTFYRDIVILNAGNIILVTSHLLRLYVWWETFRKAKVKPEDKPERRRELRNQPLAGD